MILKSEKLKQIQKTLEDFKIECIDYIKYKMDDIQEDVVMDSEWGTYRITKNLELRYNKERPSVLTDASINLLTELCDYIQLYPLKTLK